MYIYSYIVYQQYHLVGWIISYNQFYKPKNNKIHRGMQRILSKTITSRCPHNLAQPILLPLLPPRLYRYNYRPAYSFAIEAPKQVNMNKQCMRLLYEYLKVKTSVEALERTYQLSTFEAMKLLDVKIKDISMWQVANITRNYGYLWVQKPQPFFKLLQKLAQFHNPEKYRSFNLNTPKHIQQFFQLLEYLQKRTHPHFSRIALSLLTKYLENYFQIDEVVYLQIAEYLTVRAYVPESLMRNLRNFRFEDELKAIRGKIWGGNSGGIGVAGLIKEFRRVMCFVGVVVNVEHCQEIGLQLGAPVMEPRVRDLLIQTFFMFLQDIQILPYLLADTPPSQLLNPKLFPKHKSTYLAIIKKILAPLTFGTTKMHPKLLNAIFDRLLVYTQQTQEDRDIVVDILERFIRCVRSHAGSGLNGIMGPGNGNEDEPKDYGSLIMLCEKFQYYQQELFYYLAMGYVRPELSTFVGQFYTWNYFQLIYFYNYLLKASVQLATLLSLSNSQNFSLNQFIQELLHKNLQSIAEHNQKYRNEIRSIISTITIEQIRERNLKPDGAYQTHFKQSGQFYIYSNLEEGLRMAQETEREFGVKLDLGVLDDFSHPVNFNHCPAARIKALYTIQRYYRQLSKYKNFVSQIDSILCQNAQVLYILKNNISFPGLLQSAYLYHYTKPQSANSQQLKTKKFSQGQTLSNNELIRQFLQQNRNRMSNKLIDILTNGQREMDKDGQVVPAYCKNLEFLNRSVGFRVSKYGRNQVVLNDFGNFAIIDNMRKYQKLKLKTIQQLKSLLRDKILGPKIRGFDNFVDFPFVSNFLIIQNNVQYPIFFVDEAIKQKYESRLRQDQQSKPQQKSKQKPVKTPATEVTAASAIGVKKKQSSSAGKKHIKSFTEECIQYFSKNSNVILISCQEDIKNIASFILQKKATI